MAQYQTSHNNIFYNTPTVSKSTSYGAVLADNIINVSAVPVTITMPAPVSSNNGKQWTIKDVSGSASTVNPITITATSATIDGSSNIYISQPYGSVTVYSNGATYFTVMPALMSINVQQFTTTGAGTYTPSKGMQYCIVKMVGAGGAGGSPATPGTNLTSIAAAGASGGYAEFLLTASQVGTSLALSVGIAGTAVAGTTGNTGGTTSLGTAGAVASCTGGAGGGVTNSTSSGSVAGSSGGTGVVSIGSQIVTMTGQGGGGATGEFNAGVFIICFGGPGGSNPLGFGGYGNFIVATNTSQPGIAGLGFGSGGSGGLICYNGTAVAGGAGAKGIIIITEYIGP